MKVLIDCERSQTVCKAFRDKGAEAYSCDLEDEYGGYPQWHIKEDAIKMLHSRKWDLVIAHPPCTFLANSGVKHLYIGGQKENGWNMQRLAEMYAACNFFRKFVLYGKLGNKIGIENPIMHGHAKREIFLTGNGKPSQIIQPWQFGHKEQKATCLWLYNIPRLQETDNVYDEMMKLPYKERAKVHYASPGPDRSTVRSKTCTGIAEAMANQWI